MPQVATARILLFTATVNTYRHDSIPAAIEALISQSAKYNVQFDASEDKSVFSDENLALYDGVMFVSSGGDVFDDAGKEAFQNYLNKGGNFIGVHMATGPLDNCAFYEKEIGAYFDYHPPLVDFIVDVVGPQHPSTIMLPNKWHVHDEAYNYKSDPRDHGAVIILSADQSSYSDDGTRKFDHGAQHPTAWFQEHGAGAKPEEGIVAGRSFYSSLGHTIECWKDDLFIAHIMGGVMWAVGSGTTKAFDSTHKALVGNATPL